MAAAKMWHNYVSLVHKPVTNQAQN